MRTGANVTRVPLSVHVPTLCTSIVDSVHPVEVPSVGVSLAPHSFKVELLNATVPWVVYMAGITPAESLPSGSMVALCP